MTGHFTETGQWPQLDSGGGCDLIRPTRLAQDDDPSLVVKDEIDHRSLAVLSEEVRAHIRLGPLAIVSLTAPWCGFEDGHEFGVTGKSLRSAATCSRACCSDSPG
jgi:hypothetical protein